MKPHIATKDLTIFKKYLNQSKIYFEFGSGGSTYTACHTPCIEKVFSVESDKQWIDTVREQVQTDKLIQIFNEMGTVPNSWGHPGPNATNQQKISYSNHIVSSASHSDIDIVFIDGRFRVACCLKAFQVIKEDCFVLFDDFLNRPHYHVVLNYFDIIEKTSDNRLVVLRKKKGTHVPEDIIKKYELIHD